MKNAPIRLYSVSMDETRKLSKEGINKIVYELMLSNSIFAKCPTCSKYLNIFEVHNGNCGSCGHIEMKDIILIKI